MRSMFRHTKAMDHRAGDIFDRLASAEHNRDGRGEPEAKRQRTMVDMEDDDTAGQIHCMHHQFIMAPFC